MDFSIYLSYKQYKPWVVVTLVVPEISIQAVTGQIPQELDFDIKIYKKEVSWAVPGGATLTDEEGQQD